MRCVDGLFFYRAREFIDAWYIPATGEAARRYYSAWQCKHVASGTPSLPWSAFGKFFDYSDQSNFAFPKNFFVFSLKETLQKFDKNNICG